MWCEAGTVVIGGARVGRPGPLTETITITITGPNTQIMQAPDAIARRDGRLPATARGPGRWRLGKREWQDVRRAARMLSESGAVYAAEMHGIKIFFRWDVAHQTKVETKAGTPAKEPSAGGSAAKAQRNSPQTPRKPNARQRRSAERLKERPSTRAGRWIAE